MKALKIGLISLGALLAFILLVLTIANAAFDILYSEFYKGAQRDFRIPGLSTGFVPQGFDDTGDKMLVAGYMKNKDASRIYVIDSEGKETYVELYNADGTKHVSHAGGVSHKGDYVYLAGDGRLEVMHLSDVTDGDGKASIVSTFDPDFDPAWCTVRGEYILLGSFANSASKDYPPDPKETIVTPAGDTNVSIIKVFKFNDRAFCGINPQPVAVISTGEKVQGLAFIDDENLVLSTSYGLSSSKLIFHKINTGTKDKYRIDGGDVPLIYLDSSTETKVLKAPPMSEELVVKDGYLYVMNESACNKYLFGKVLGQTRVYKYKL